MNRNNSVKSERNDKNVRAGSEEKRGKAFVSIPKTDRHIFFFFGMKNFTFVQFFLTLTLHVDDEHVMLKIARARAKMLTFSHTESLDQIGWCRENDIWRRRLTNYEEDIRSHFDQFILEISSLDIVRRLLSVMMYVQNIKKLHKQHKLSTIMNFMNEKFSTLVGTSMWCESRKEKMKYEEKFSTFLLSMWMIQSDYWVHVFCVFWRPADDRLRSTLDYLHNFRHSRSTLLISGISQFSAELINLFDIIIILPISLFIFVFEAAS